MSKLMLVRKFSDIIIKHYKKSMNKLFSGIKPTGKIHLGNYLGALKNWVELQEKYQCLYFIADLHALTIKINPDELRDHSLQLAIDLLSLGIDPKKAVLFRQSDVIGHTELAWIFNCLTPVSELERIPTYKEKIEKHPDDINAGLFNYPVLMTADILGPRAELVPVGKDQKPNLELAAQLARKFNRLYGRYFPIPDSLEEEMITVPGLSIMDERGGFPKMGKSEGNTIVLSETAEETRLKIMVAPTDPQRQHRTDPGNPSHCSIFSLHQLISPVEDMLWSRGGCKTASIGCTECKEKLSGNVNAFLAEFRERRRELSEKTSLIRDVLEAGRVRATAVFDETIAVVRERLGIG